MALRTRDGKKRYRDVVGPGVTQVEIPFQPTNSGTKPTRFYIGTHFITFHGQNVYDQSALRQIVVDAAAIPDTRNVFISVLADNAPRRHVIEKVGFQHYASVVRRMRFGVETHAITHVKGA